MNTQWACFAIYQFFMCQLYIKTGSQTTVQSNHTIALVLVVVGSLNGSKKGE